jgi:hypothetical protein
VILEQSIAIIYRSSWIKEIIIMYRVYKAVPMGLDEHLGHVNEDGKVYRSKVGLDDHLGTVDLSSGKIYTERFGPNKKIGHVNLKNGKVYLSKFGIDEYVGSMDDHGHMHRHVPMGADEYIGKIDPFVSYAHAAGAMLLLVLPAVEGEEQEENPDNK